MNHNEYKVTLYSTSTEQGRDLADRLSSTLPSYITDLLVMNGCNGASCESVEVLYPGDKDYDSFHFHIRQRKNDLIIFDGSIEESEECRLGDNYMCVPHAPYMNPNVIVVSRTVLPLNFIPHTSNVLPFGENFKKDDEGGIIPVRSYSNESIVTFLTEQIAQMIRAQFVGALKIKKRGSSVKKDPQLFLHTDGEKVAFISYRSFYNSRKCGNYSVQDLSDYIISYHTKITPGEKWKVLFYPPGGLSQDCPTEYLRWALMTYVENVFIHVDEVWIFNTDGQDEESYWDSWFTQGEYISLMSIRQGIPNYMPKTYIFNPHTGEHQQFQIEHSIPEEEKAYLSLVSANSDILWGDYAALRNIILSVEKFKEVSGKPALRGKGRLAKMLNKHPYSKEFLTNRIFRCPDCARKGNKQETMYDKIFIRGFINIGYDTETAPGYFVVDEASFGKAVDDGFVECPTCHKRFCIKRNPDQDFYLWKKWTQRTNPMDDWYIERIPAYDISD